MDNFKLKNWLVDVKLHRIRRPGATQDEAIVLPEQVMNVLIFFSLHPNEDVSREQLRHALWQDIADADKLIKDAVSSLKEALDDNQPVAQIIKVVDDSSYRLLAIPEPVSRPKNLPEPPPDFNIQSAKSPVTSLTAIVVMGIFGLALTFFGLLYYKQSPTQPATARENSISVQRPGDTVARLVIIPFSNDSGDAEDEYLGDGITEALLDSLSNLTTVDVIARSSSFTFKSQPLNQFQFANQLNVPYLLTGSVKRHKNRLQVNVKLVSDDNSTEFWSQSYNIQYAELFDLQATIAADTAKKFKTVLPDNRQTQTNRLGNQNIEAYDLYMHGRFYANKQTAAALQQAVTLFEQAISKDPLFALAYAELAKVYLLQGSKSFLTEAQSTNKALETIAKALQLSPNLAQTQAAQGLVMARLGQQDKAITAYKNAIGLKPNYAPAHLWLGMLYHDRQDFNDAKAPLTKALSLDPNQLVANHYIGKNLLSMGELDSGIDYLTRAIDSTSGSAQIEMELARWYYNYGFQGKANQWAEVANAKAPEQHGSQIAMAFGATSRQQRQQWIASAHQTTPTDAANFFATVNLYYYSGDLDALRDYVQQVLFTPNGHIDTEKPASWLLWAGIVRIKDADFDHAIALLEFGLTAYKDSDSNPIGQIQLLNQLAYAYKKTGETAKLNNIIKRTATVQQLLLKKGLKTPFFMIEMVASFILKGEHQTAERFLRNATAKGWRLDNYINNHPVFELMPGKAQFLERP